MSSSLLSKKSRDKIDEKQLRLLKFFHYALAGLTAIFSSFFLFHITSDWHMTYGLLMGWGYSALLVFTGKSIAKRSDRTFILVSAGISCCHAPVGLALGIFSFIVLMRPSVRDLFGDRTDLPYQQISARTTGLEEPDLLVDPDEVMWRELEEKAKSETLNCAFLAEESPAQAVKLSAQVAQK